MAEHDIESLQARTDFEVFEDIAFKLAIAAKRLRRDKEPKVLEASERARQLVRPTVHSVWEKSGAGRQIVYEVRDEPGIDGRFQAITVWNPYEKMLVALSNAGLINLGKLFYKSISFYVNHPDDREDGVLPEVFLSTRTMSRIKDPEPQDITYLQFEALCEESGLYEKVTPRNTKPRPLGIATILFSGIES